MSTLTLRALVVYESMFGGTEQIARAIATGLEQTLDVRVGSIEQIPAGDVDHVDLVIVGGPTHAHGMSTPATRAQAVLWTREPARNLTLVPGTHDNGVREWLTGLSTVPRFAAFDTRASIPRLLSGAASHAIARALAQHGGTALAEPESFLVDTDNGLVDDEVSRALAWGSSLATALSENIALS